MIKKFFLIVLVIFCALVFWYYWAKNKNRQNEFTIWTIQLKPVAQEVIEENISYFQQIHPGVKITWVDIPIAEAQKRTLAAVLGKNPPDLINLNPDFSVILAQRGALDYFSEDEGKKFIPSTVDMLRYNGKIFALPFYATSSVTLYNKKLYNSCGYENPPKTYEELANYAQNLKNCTGIYPLAINLNENDSLAKILNKYNITTFENEEETARAISVYSMFNDLYKKNLISKDTLTINHREMAEKYMSGSALFVVLGSNFLNMVKENAPQIYPQSDISAQLLGDSQKYDVALMNFVIPKYAKHKALAHEFVNVLTGEDAQIKLAKLTNVIPVNKEALKNEYFSQCSSDLIAKARCESIKQLENSGNKDFGVQNKKEINDAINKTAETILLDNSITEKSIENKVKELANTIKRLKG